MGSILSLDEAGEMSVHEGHRWRTTDDQDNTRR
jgi:hypothetical protein